MPLSLETFAVVASLAISFGALIVSMLSLRHARAKLDDKKTNDLEKRLDRSDQRLTTMEQKIEALPSRDELHELSLQSEQLSGDIKALSAQLGGVKETITAFQATTGRIEGFLLNNGAQK